MLEIVEKIKAKTPQNVEQYECIFSDVVCHTDLSISWFGCNYTQQRTRTGGDISDNCSMLKINSIGGKKKTPYPWFAGRKS